MYMKKAIANPEKNVNSAIHHPKLAKTGKPHIGIFGRRNNGKSSFINVLTGQDIAIVSEIPGTTTDPVKKSIEIFGIGPVIVIDTAGIDDEGELGLKRIRKTLDTLKLIDCGILIIADNQFGLPETVLIDGFKKYEIPFLIIHNKSDHDNLSASLKEEILKQYKVEVFEFSTIHPDNLQDIIDGLRKIIPDTAYKAQTLIGDLVMPGDYVLLITPIDNEAPEGRMILPQQMAIRDVLDHDCINIVLKETELEHFFKTFPVKPALAITDSQAFERVSKIVPDDIPLTGFSLVFARLKGEFETYLKDTPKIDQLKDGDRVLILESCTHQVNCDDIGRIKLPKWLKEFTGKQLEFDIVPGLGSIPEEIKNYAMVIQCGGCMVTKKQISSRLKAFIEAGIPVTNYGMSIAYMNGIFERTTRMFIKNE